MSVVLNTLIFIFIVLFSLKSFSFDFSNCKENFNSDLSVDGEDFNWYDIKHKCRAYKNKQENYKSGLKSLSVKKKEYNQYKPSAHYYDEATESIGFCFYFPEDAAEYQSIEIMNEACHYNFTGDALIETFSNNCTFSISRVKCSKSDNDIKINQYNEEQKKRDVKKEQKEQTKTHINQLKKECSELGFKDGKDDFKKCVMELMEY